MLTNDEIISKLKNENNALREALAGIIPWAGEMPEGPSWATSEAKQRNHKAFEEALQGAVKCFPANHGQTDPDERASVNN
jgi:hypothetical protein